MSIAINDKYIKATSNRATSIFTVVYASDQEIVLRYPPNASATYPRYKILNHKEITNENIYQKIS